MKSKDIFPSYLCRFKGANTVIISAILNRCICKSPYSDSYYSSEDKTWDYTPDGCVRVSNHWNFKSSPRGQVGRKKVHCKTDVPVDGWAIGVYSKKRKLYVIEYVVPQRTTKETSKTEDLKKELSRLSVDTLTFPIKKRKSIKKENQKARLRVIREKYYDLLPKRNNKEIILKHGDCTAKIDCWNEISYFPSKNKTETRIALRNARTILSKRERLYRLF